MKFKVGDIVEVIKNPSDCWKLGSRHEIIAANSGSNRYYTTNLSTGISGNFFQMYESDFKLVETPKSLLKIGMRVVTRLEGNYILVSDEVLTTTGGWNRLSDYDEDLNLPPIYDGDDVSEWDVMEIYNPPINAKWLDPYAVGELVWKRNPSPKDLQREVVAKLQQELKEAEEKLAKM